MNVAVLKTKKRAWEFEVKKSTLSAALVVAVGSTAHAGGFERTPQSINILFKEGTYAEIGVGGALPNVSGVGTGGLPNFPPTNVGAETNNIAEDFIQFEGGVKFDIDESFSAAIIYDEPYATDIKYPADTNYLAAGTKGFIKIREIKGVVQYNLPDSMSAGGGDFSVFAGPRVSHLRSGATIPFLQYDIDVESKFGVGFLAGVAWERPELGMRASLTYHSKINNELTTTETLAGTSSVTETQVDLPSSWDLQFQTGINPKTLLFGSIRYVPWDDFSIDPPTYTQQFNAPLATFSDGYFTYRLGLGRKLTEDLSVFGEVGYEPQSEAPQGSFTPRDGFFSIGGGGSFTYDKVSLTLGGRYAFLGDADVNIGGNEAAQFRDNSAVLLGARLGYSFD